MKKKEKKRTKTSLSPTKNQLLAEKTTAPDQKFDLQDIPLLVKEIDTSISNAKIFLSNCKDSSVRDVFYSLLNSCQRQRQIINSLNSLTEKLVPRLDKVENSERNRTVVISGPSLPLGKSIFEQRVLDQKLCNSICDYLAIPCTPTVFRTIPRSSPSSPKQNKKENNNLTSNAPALIKMVLPSLALQRHAVVNARKLRDDEPRFHGIFINPLRTPQEQRLYNENRALIQTLRRQNIPAVLYKQEVYINQNGKLTKYS